MQIKPRLYPHPVLAWFSDDYGKALFQPSIQVQGNKGFYKISVTCKTSSKSLNALIRDKTAAFALHFECPSTRFREIFKSYEECFEIDIPVGSIDGKVEICPLIVATENITNYSSAELHPDFTGRSFNLLIGDTLAVSYDVTIYADKKEDQLANLPSIFSVVRNDASDAASIDVGLMDNRILIRLSKQAYESFRNLVSDSLLITTLSSSVIVPGLVYALEQVIKLGDEAQEEYQQYRWYRVLAKKLKEKNYDIEKLGDCPDSSIVIANSLIGDSLTQSLRDLEQVVSGQGD